MIKELLEGNSARDVYLNEQDDSNLLTLYYANEEGAKEKVVAILGSIISKMSGVEGSEDELSKINDIADIVRKEDVEALTSEDRSELEAILKLATDENEGE